MVRPNNSQVHQRSADKLLKLCCRNGGCFIKVGQHIGSLDYLLPKEYVNTLKVLHDKAPESSREQVLQVIREDLGEQVSHTLIITVRNLKVLVTAFDGLLAIFDMFKCCRNYVKLVAKIV